MKSPEINCAIEECKIHKLSLLPCIFPVMCTILVALLV